MTDEQIERIIDALPVRPTDKVLLRFAREIERAVLAEQAALQQAPARDPLAFIDSQNAVANAFGKWDRDENYSVAHAHAELKAVFEREFRAQQAPAPK